MSRLNFCLGRLGMIAHSPACMLTVALDLICCYRAMLCSAACMMMRQARADC